MANHPLNLTLRFILELFAIFAYGYWGWTEHVSPIRFLWSFGSIILVAVVWRTFRVPGDPGNAPVAVPGIFRLLLECLIFGGAVWALYHTNLQEVGIVFGAIVFLHYLISYDRIDWLLKH
jgi:hypothetical protein